MRCLEVKDIAELDRLFWCDVCREQARRRSARSSRLVAAVVTGLLAAWTFLWVAPAQDMVPVWLVILLAVYYLTYRITREVGYGAMRFRNRGAVEAVPPDAPTEPGAPSEPDAPPPVA